MLISLVTDRPDSLCCELPLCMFSASVLDSFGLHNLC